MVEFTRKEKNIFGDISSLSKRLADDCLYEIVAWEIFQGDHDPVARLKTLEGANGDTEAANAIYACHRIRRLKDLAAKFSITQKVEADRTVNRNRRERHALTVTGPRFTLFLAAGYPEGRGAK